MAQRYPGLVLGFHGCDRSIAERVVAGLDNIKASHNPYDWLGHGIYFWENNSSRAMRWAEIARDNPRPNRPTIIEPAVIGAVLDLGNCLNLADSRFLSLLPDAYKEFEHIVQLTSRVMPTNRPVENSKDILRRDLDCAVIETLHQLRMEEQEPRFDSARGIFTEGEPLFPGGAIQQGNHIQICVRNLECVRGYFFPRDL